MLLIGAVVDRAVHHAKAHQAGDSTIQGGWQSNPGHATAAFTARDCKYLSSSDNKPFFFCFGDLVL